MADSEKVSSGNEAVDEAVVTLGKKVDTNTFEVPVDMLDTNHFQNVRTAYSEDKISEYRHSLKEQGQIQNISVVALDNGKLAVFAGYSRTEAFNRNVHDPLIKKWNQEHNLASTDPNFLIVTNPEHREIVAKAYPEEFDKEKSKKHNLVRVYVDETVKNPGVARLKGFIENFQRADLSLADTFAAVDNMIDVDGISAQSVARSLKKSPSAISQYRRASKLPSTLREFLVTPDEGETFNESDLAKLKEDVNTLMNEYDRRIALQKDNKDYHELNISLSHIREFSQMVVKGAQDADDWKCPLTRSQAMTLLCDLVGADEKTHKLRPGQSPKNYGVWVSTMKSMADVTKKRREGGPEAAAAETTTAAAEGSETGTIAGLAEQQVSSGKTAEAAAAEANADATVAPAPAEAKAEGEAAASESKVDSEKIAEELVGSATDDDSEEPLDVAPVEAGLTKKKTQVAPISQAKVKDANAILGMVNTLIDYVNESVNGGDEDELAPNVGLIAGALNGAQIGYEVLGFDSLSKALVNSTTEFCESLEAYIVGLEEYVEKVTKKYKAPAFTMERPIPILPTELQAEKIEDEDIDDELAATGDEFADEDDEPGDDDLKEIDEE